MQKLLTYFGQFSAECLPLVIISQSIYSPGGFGGFSQRNAKWQSTSCFFLNLTECRVSLLRKGTAFVKGTGLFFFRKMNGYSYSTAKLSLFAWHDIRLVSDESVAARETLSACCTPCKSYKCLFCGKLDATSANPTCNLQCTMCKLD